MHEILPQSERCFLLLNLHFIPVLNDIQEVPCHSKITWSEIYCSFHISLSKAFGEVLCLSSDQAEICVPGYIKNIETHLVKVSARNNK